LVGEGVIRNPCEMLGVDLETGLAAKALLIAESTATGGSKPAATITSW